MSDCCDSINLSTAQCPASDPGIEDAGRFLAVYDALFRLRRLASPDQNSVLFIAVGGGGNPQFTWTNEPLMLPPALDIGVNDKFTGLQAAVGDNGAWRYLNPTAAGPLLADALGNWYIGTFPSATVPDPLTLTTLTAGTVTVTSALIVQGTASFPTVAPGTIVTTIGLNASGLLVSGAVDATSSAQYFEASTPTFSGTSPNDVIPAAGNPLVIGNRISDPDGLVKINNSTELEIVEPGLYTITWYGAWQARGNSGTSGYNPAIYLAIGNSTTIVSFGNGFTHQDNNSSAISMGSYTARLVAGQKVYLIAQGTFNVTGRTLLSNVTITFNRVKT